MSSTTATIAPPVTLQRAGSSSLAPLFVIASAHLMAVLDTTVMFVALPSAQRALGLSVTARQWVVTSYTLAFAALLLLGGRLADRFGARRTLIVGVVGFACASAVGGASIDGAMLIGARAIQGAFGALLVSSTKSLLITVYTDERSRSRAIGIFTATLTAGLAIGLILGGVLTSELGWRFCLYVNVVVALIVVIGAPKVLPDVEARHDIRIDLVSAVLASIGMVGLIYGLAEVPALGWTSGKVISSLSLSTGLLVCFVRYQVAKEHPLLPLRVVRDRNRAGGLLAMMCNSLSTFGMLLILTYELQSVMGYSPLRTGLALVPFAAAAAAGSAFIAPRLMGSIAPRWLVVSGLFLSALGLLSLVFLHASTHELALIVVAEVIEGLGTGLGGPPILQSSLRKVLPNDVGAASSASSAAGQLGSSVGAALLNTIAATATASYLTTHLHTAPVIATVHGYTVAMIWGAIVLLAVIVPVALLINANKPGRAA